MTPPSTAVSSWLKRKSTLPVAAQASYRICSNKSCEDITGRAGLISAPGPSKPVDSISPICSPMPVVKKRIGDFQPGGVSTARNRS